MFRSPLLSFVSIILCFLSNIEETKASHVLGSETSWRNLGNDSFEITLVVFTRCTDGASPFILSPPSITSDSCANSYSVSLGNPIDSTYIDLTPVCITQQKPCTFSGGNGSSSALIPLGYLKVTWRYKIYLGGAYSNCCWYKIRWQICCRSGNPPISCNQDFINDVMLNRCVSNNSPTYSNDPMVIKCAGQDVIYNMGAIDEDRDSLSYRLVPLINCSYSSPWSHTYPVTSLGGNNPNPNANPPTGFNINPINGDLFFIPMQVQISVIKVEVLEWRKINGVYKIIGKTSRDLQIFITQNCNNRLPTNVGYLEYEVCAGSQLCITINTNDQDISDTTKIRSNANLAIPNASWTVTPDTLLRGTGTFCWTPVDSNISTLPYYFNVIVNDNHCPLQGTKSRAYSITVKQPIKYTTNLTHRIGGEWKFEISPIGNYSNTNYQWYVPKLLGQGIPNVVWASTQIASYFFTQNGRYIIRSKMYNSTMCAAEKFDTLDVYCATPLLLVSSRDTSLCIGSPILLSTTVLNGNAPYNYKWYANGVLVDSLPSVTMTPLVNTLFRVVVYSNDTCQNIAIDTVIVKVDTTTLKLQHTENIRICQGFQLNITPQIIGTKVQSYYRWYYNGVLISNSNSLIHSPQISGIYIFEVQSNGDCIVNVKDTFSVLVDTNRLSMMHLNDTTICNPTSNFILKVKIKTGQAPFHFKWFSNGVLIDTLENTTVSVNSTERYAVEVTSADSCYGTIRDTLNVYLDTFSLQVNKLADIFICQGSLLMLQPDIVSGQYPLQYEWYKNNSLFSNLPTLLDFPSTPSTYILKIISSNNCRNIFLDTVIVSFTSNNLVIKIPKDTTVCANTPVTLSAQVTGITAPYKYNWCPEGKVCSQAITPTYFFNSTTIVYLEVTASDNCNSTKVDSMIVRVFPLKQLIISSTNTTIITGQTTVLKVSNGTNFTWIGNDIQTNWGDSILVKPVVNSTYKAIGINANGCVDTSEITILVNNVGINKSSNVKNNLLIYPNPAKDELVVSGDLLIRNEITFSITNTLSQVLIEGILKEEKTTIVLESLASGIYFIHIGNEAYKFIKH